MQLWKLDHMKLRNKAGFWISTDDWNLLKPGTGEIIEELDQIDEILEHDQKQVNVRNKSNQTYLEKSDDDNVGSGTSVVEKTIKTNPQKWMIEKKANENHFFKLKLPESEKYLTATSSGGLTIEGKA
jgi:hypothetical protein